LVTENRTLKTRKMKSLLKWILMVTVLTVGFIAAIPATKASAQDDYVSYQTFYDDLSPYGEWVSDPQYGYVWVPDVESDFRPYYTRGYWAATDYGNMWVSDYPWGWATFHYGRWTYDPYYGWVWIPGDEWGPAWVSWRSGGGYYGWAPMGPGISLSVSFGSYYCPDNWWVFVGPQYLYRHDFHRYWRGAGYNTTIIHNTYFINNNYHNRYVYGPRPDEIQRVTHQRVNVYNVNTGHRPGPAQLSGNSLNVFRPQIRNATSNGGRPAPARALQAPRAVSTRPQSVTNTRPEFRTAVQNRQVQPVQRNNVTPAIRPQNTRQQPVQQQLQPQRQQQVQPERRFDNRPQQLQPQRQQPVQQQPSRFDNRPQQVQPQRQPVQQQPDRRFDNRPQQVPQQQRFENRPQPAPQQQRFENRPQSTPQQQRFENRPQPAPQQQHFENRPQPAPQQQHFENKPQPQQQHFENRPQPMPQPRPQPTPAPRQENNNLRGGRR
jgi:hypothetical protein